MIIKSGIIEIRDDDGNLIRVVPGEVYIPENEIELEALKMIKNDSGPPPAPTLH